MNKKTELEEKIENFIRPEIRALSAYHVPDSKNLIKLDAMENPYQWPDDLVDQWLEVIRDVELNRYPDPGARILKQHLREAMAVPTDAEILLGNGSDELIQMIMMAMAGKDSSGNARSVLSVEPGFVMYKMIATFMDMPYIGVPLNDDFSLNETVLIEKIKETQPAVIFLAYPNNPTSNLFDEQTIRNIIDVAPGVVVIDEAYHAFAEKSFMPMLNEYDNLLVMRTVSKMGLAGLRLGLLAGKPEWLNEFDKVRLPYNINILTQASAEFAIKNRHVLDQQTQQICVDREQLFNELSKIKNITTYPSQANFILLRLQQGQADKVFTTLKNKGILIKNLNPAGGLLKDCLRITVGTEEENKKFLEIFKTAL
ncbi:MAG: histidinol-phosphate transaminase [Gammaproteobacteria bacterium]|nr:histidinol-phosphate transaminase [Gammaproteobacteria bacterium]